MIASAACTDTDSATNLNPEGPPMIRQVRMSEKYISSAGFLSERVVFAFGAHPLAPDADVHPVQTAKARGNQLRVIMDELLVGNNLEEIACRGFIRPGTDPDSRRFGRVPLGADPDDIARCSVANDVLPSRCPSSDRHAVCICEDPAGCQRPTGMPFQNCPTNTVLSSVKMGEPVGVLDCNGDGATDDTQFIDGAVTIQCGSIAVPLDRQGSYWNPSGDQNKPAMGGFDALGPALVLAPPLLPTNVTCKLVFDSAVVDKQNIAVCAPAGGDIAAGCTPGNTDAFKFGVEPLTIEPASFVDNEMGVSRSMPLLFAINAPVDTATLSMIQISPAPPGAVMTTAPMGTQIRIAFGTPLDPNTAYTITFPVAVTDTFSQALPQALTYRFTTGA